MIPRRLALTGKMGSGKSHVAGLLVPLGYQRLHFATPLKDAARALDPDPSRELLQALSDVTRQVEPRPLLERMREALAGAGRHVVIDDCRFPDELELLLEHGFRPVRVDAPITERLDRLEANGRLESPVQLLHGSESALAHVQMPVIHNYGLTDKELLAQLEELVWG